MSNHTYTGIVALGAAMVLSIQTLVLSQGAGTSDAPLTLAAAVSEALVSNPATRAATQQFAQAQARLSQAQAGQRFQITFNSSTSGTNATFFQPPPRNQTAYLEQNTLTIPLPLGHRPGLFVRQANGLLQAARAQFTSAQALLAFQVTTAYYDLLRKQALLQLAQETVTQDQRQLDETRQRNKAGDVPDLDVLRAQVPVASAQAQQIGAENDVAVAQQTLNSLLGRTLDAPLTVADISPTAAVVSSLTLDQARIQALAYAPELRVAQATVEADQAALRAAQLYREPTVSVQIADARSNDQTNFSRADTALASVTVPLSDGGLSRAQVREAEAALTGAQDQVDVARRATLAAVSAAYLTAQSARRQVAAAQVARDIAQVSADKTVLGYRNGLYTLSDVLNAQAALTQARIAYAQAIYDAAAGAAGLSAALNGGLVTSTAATMPSPTPTPLPSSAPGTDTAGSSPAGASTPGASPAGSTAAGTNPGGANAPGSGAP